MTEPKFKLGDFVAKTKGSQWRGRVVGTYSTKLTPEGYAVESSAEGGSVQIYPAAALELARPSSGDFEVCPPGTLARVNDLEQEARAMRTRIEDMAREMARFMDGVKQQR